MQRQATGNTDQAGFTLIEQIMVLLIAAVLGSIAIPALSGLLSRTRLQSAQMDLLAAFQHARETAATTGKVTLICPTADGLHCRADNRWDSGWLLAHDVDRDHQPDDNRVLHVGQGYGGKLTIRSNNGRPFMRFLPDGSTGGTNLTLLLCLHGSKEATLSVVISRSGRIRGALANKDQITECAGAN